MRRCHKEMIWDPSYPAPARRSPAAGRASRSRERMSTTTARCSAPLDEDAVRARRAAAARRSACTSIAVMYLFSFVNPAHELRAARDRARGVPRRRAHLALARGDAARPRVRAGVDHARERVRRAADRALHVGRLEEQLRARRLRRAAADHAVDRWRDAARLRRPARGHAARVRPDRRRDGRDARRRSAPASTTSSPSTWAAPASTSASCATAGPRSRPTGTGATATTSASRWSTCRASARAAVRSRGCARARCSSARSRPARCPVRSVTAAAANAPTVTDADAVLGYLPADGFAGGRMQLDVDAAARRDRSATSPSRSASTSTEAAWGIERIVNANMANATRKVLAGHGADPRDARADRVRRQRRGARVGDRRRARRRPHPRAEGGARVLRARRARRRLRRRPRALVRHAARRRSTSAALRALMTELDRRGRARSSSPTGLDAADDRRDALRADVLPGPELRHERAGARGRRRSTSPACSTSPSASTTSTRPSAASASATSSR